MSNRAYHQQIVEKESYPCGRNWPAAFEMRDGFTEPSLAALPYCLDAYGFWPAGSMRRAEIQGQIQIAQTWAWEV